MQTDLLSDSLEVQDSELWYLVYDIESVGWLVDYLISQQTAFPQRAGGGGGGGNSQYMVHNTGKLL